MPNHQFEPLNVALNGLSVQSAANFCGQIIENPEVVVSCKKLYSKSLVGKFGQFAERPHSAFGHGFFVFKPEIEQIANQIKRLCLGCNLIEPTRKRSLALKAVRAIGGPEVEVRNEKALLQSE